MRGRTMTKVSGVGHTSHESPAQTVPLEVFFRTSEEGPIATFGEKKESTK